jgi:hypothetical protein
VWKKKELSLSLSCVCTHACVRIGVSACIHIVCLCTCVHSRARTHTHTYTHAHAHTHTHTHTRTHALERRAFSTSLIPTSKVKTKFGFTLRCLVFRRSCKRCALKRERDEIWIHSAMPCSSQTMPEVRLLVTMPVTIHNWIIREHILYCITENTFYILPQCRKWCAY